jgi:3-methylcrotonyl-CoA carboxylase alpha subunit
MEMNTRLQVEHPVTEMVTGLDLVEWQIRVAAGEPLPLQQSEIGLHGHAIEARLYAEDPARGFLPSIGRIAHWRMPASSASVRVDTGVRAGDEVSPYYDPMLAKLIVHAQDRSSACRRLATALSQCEIAGVATNVAFLERVVSHDAFASGRLDTGLIDKHRDELFATEPSMPDRALVVAALGEYFARRAVVEDDARHSRDRYSPWNALDGWWPNRAPIGIPLDFADGDAHHPVAIHPRYETAFDIVIAGRTLHVSAQRDGDRLVVEHAGKRFEATVVRSGEDRFVFAPGARRRMKSIDPLAHAGEGEEHAGHMMAPMSGTIVAVLVGPGDTVAKGAPLVVLEAMKMEHTIVAPGPGVVAAVNCGVGDRVSEGADLVDLEDADTSASPRPE